MGYIKFLSEKDQMQYFQKLLSHNGYIIQQMTDNNILASRKGTMRTGLLLTTGLTGAAFAGLRHDDEGFAVVKNDNEYLVTWQGKDAKWDARNMIIQINRSKSCEIIEKEDEFNLNLDKII